MNVDLQNQIENFKLSTVTSERAESSELRIVSWNILSEELTPEAPEIGTRIERITDTIRAFAPDAAGIQEISESCYTMLDELLGDTYEFVNPKTKDGNFSFTGIMYNKKTCEMLDNDIIVYPLGNKRIRIATWLYLYHKATSRHFVLLSTHWDVHACNRVTQAECMAALVHELHEKFNCPVICTGDFNAKEDSNAFKTFIRLSRHLDAKYNCPLPINNCFTGHPIGTWEPEKEGNLSIDHITATPDMKFLHFETVINETVIHLSDHFPLYADMKF